VKLRHQIDDIKLIAGFYGFTGKATALEKDTGGADRLDQLRPLNIANLQA